MQFDISENLLYSCFVSPNLCKELEDAGFLSGFKMPYRWHIYVTGVKLVTTEFDLDDYYAEGLKHVNAMYPPQHIVTAYTIKDCEMVLPPYDLSINDCNNYTLGSGKFFSELESVTEQRMPDLFGRFLLKAIRKNCLKLHEINSKFYSC